MQTHKIELADSDLRVVINALETIAMQNVKKCLDKGGSASMCASAYEYHDILPV